MFDGAMEAIESFDGESRSDCSTRQYVIAATTANARIQPMRLRVDWVMPNIKQAQLLVLW